MNDVISGLQSHHPELIQEFLGDLSLARERSNMPGLMLNGRQMDKLIREDSLVKLSDLLKKIKSKFLVSVDYLRILKKLHSMMVSKTLAPDIEYKTAIKEFHVLFDRVHHLELVNETPKIHLISDHLEDWFDKTRMTLWWADTSGKINFTAYRVKMGI